MGPRRVLTWVVAWWSAFTLATGWAGGRVSLVAMRFGFGAGVAGCFPNLTKAFSIWLQGAGPLLAELVPVFRNILERSRLLLFADHRFEELPAVLSRLPREGLYVVVPDTFLRSESEFGDFVTTHWKTD